MSDSVAGPDEDQTLAEAFWTVARRLRSRSRDSLAPWDVSPSHLRALMVLSRHGAMRLSTLSDHLHIAARSTTEVVDALEDRGLAGRRPDPDDRRATLVELTAAGIELMTRTHQVRAAEADAYFGRLSRTDREHLARILGKLSRD